MVNNSPLMGSFTDWRCWLHPASRENPALIIHTDSLLGVHGGLWSGVVNEDSHWLALVLIVPFDVDGLVDIRPLKNPIVSISRAYLPWEQVKEVNPRERRINGR